MKPNKEEMKLILIIETGATKSDWRLISETGEVMAHILGQGSNVSTMPIKNIAEIYAETSKKLNISSNDTVSSIHIYTAGVMTAQVREALTDVLKSRFPSAEVEIQDDLVAAARAMCGHKPGITVILGTGSNSCQFDGEKIVKKVYSGGFILGDEGSAAALGKLFISDLLKDLVPPHISDDFASRYDSSYECIIYNIYRSTESPSAYLGGLAPFIMEYYHEPYIRELVDGNFRAFFRRCIKQYDCTALPIGIAGGFGYAMQDIIRRIAQEEGVNITTFMQHPIEGLIKYHSVK